MSTRKAAVVTGITGQDGAYLSQLLLERDYKVYGTYRRTSSVNFWRIEELGIHSHPSFEVVEYDLTDIGTSIALVSAPSRTRFTTSRHRALSGCRSISRRPPRISPDLAR